MTHRTIPATIVLAIAMLAASTSEVHAGLPVSGVPVPAFADFDAEMQEFMGDRDISAGVLAISIDGCIVYQRGFGSLANGNGLPENAMFRIASLEKPITAAAIHRLEDDGVLSIASDRAFDLGQANPGILDYTPFGGHAGSGVGAITIRNLLDHRSGWNNDDLAIGDPQFSAIEIALAMGVSTPPARDNTIRYMLAQDLNYTRGTNGCTNDNGNATFCYLNFGYMVLGRIVEVVTGTDLLSYVRSRILRPDMWVPSTEIIYGHTLTRNPREPYYDCDGCLCPNIYDYGITSVSCPAGGWEQEVFVGHGNLVASAAPLLIYMDHYQVNVGDDSGVALNGALPHSSNHTGSLSGTSTVLRQGNDGINVVVLFNKRSNSEEYAAVISNTIAQMIRSGSYAIPTFCVDGTWVDLNGSGAVKFGNYNRPFLTLAEALSSTTAGTKLRFKTAGSTDWTGTLSERMRLDSPFGPTQIGAQ